MVLSFIIDIFPCIISLLLISILGDSHSIIKYNVPLQYTKTTYTKIKEKHFTLNLYLLSHVRWIKSQIVYKKNKKY